MRVLGVGEVRRPAASFRQLQGVNEAGHRREPGSGRGRGSKAHICYATFANLAGGENCDDVVRLFVAAAYSGRVQASNHLNALESPSKEAQNLRAARAGEDFEIVQMYPAHMAVAEMQEEDVAHSSM